MKIFTHFNVDLDAVCSVWAAKQFMPLSKDPKDIEICFQPADWNGTEMDDTDLALDIDAGGRGFKGKKSANGIVHSCFAWIVEKHAPLADQKALANVVSFVDAQDAHGSAVKFLAPAISPEAATIFSTTGLNSVLRALQATHPRNDKLVIERMSEILSGLLQAGKARGRAVSEAAQAEKPYAKVAIVKNSKEFATNGVLFEEYGVQVIIYADGNNLGLIRHGDEQLRMDHPDFRSIVEVAGETGEWFAHPAGFLYCRGSRKAPAKNLSRVDPLMLAKVASKLIG